MPKNQTTPRHEYWLVAEEDLDTAIAYRAEAQASIREFLKDQGLSAQVAQSQEDDDFWQGMSFVRPYIVTEGVLQIPVQGVMLNRFPYQLDDYATGYEYVEKAFARGMEDPEVESISLMIDSPGGVVNGLFELTDAMAEMRAASDKPVTTYVSGMAASAAYAIATVADEIVVGRMSVVGSVGVLATHIDMTGMADKAGIRVTYVYAGKNKADGQPFKKLSDSAKARIQKRVDRTYGIFTELVANNRDMSQEDVMATEALTYVAEEAIEVEFADRIGQFATDRKGRDLAGSEPITTEATNGDIIMADKTPATPAENTVENDAAVAEARADGAKAERQRFADVMASESYAGREDLAQHLLSNTDMDAKAIAATLEVSPKAVAEATTTVEDKVEDAGATTETPGASFNAEMAKDDAGVASAEVETETVSEDAKAFNELAEARKAVSG